LRQASDTLQSRGSETRPLLTLRCRHPALWLADARLLDALAVRDLGPAGFTFASFLCGLSWNIESMIVFRALPLRLGA
jgi:hypothetical protein